MLGILQSVGLARRNDQRYVGGLDNPDIALELGGTAYHVECKRAERFNAYAAIAQAERDANGHAVPVVMHRRNRAPWLVVMKLSDWVRMLKGD